jgi:hypothetical protein
MFTGIEFPAYIFVGRGLLKPTPKGSKEKGRKK